jgi:archaeal flagellin FlaB
MFCKKCGNNLPDNAKFCEKCGTSQIRPDAPRGTTHADARSMPVTDASKPSNFLKYVIIGIVGIVALVIIISAVLSSVVLGAGYFSSQKAQETVNTGAIPQYTAVPRAQETVYIGLEQAASNIEMIGNVYGLASSPSAGIDEIRFTIGPAPGAPSVDLSKLKIVFSTPGTSPVIYVQGAAAGTGSFTTKLHGVSSVDLMNANEQVEIDFKVASVQSNTRMTIELRPAVGASLPFTRTTPASIQKTNVLY